MGHNAHGRGWGGWLVQPMDVSARTQGLAGCSRSTGWHFQAWGRSGERKSSPHRRLAGRGRAKTELYLALGGVVRAGSGATSLLQPACCLPRVPGEALGWQDPASGLQPSHMRRPPACQAGCMQGGTLAEQVEGSLHFSRHSVGISSWLMPSVFVTQPWMLSTSGQGLPTLACPASRLPGLSVGQVFEWSPCSIYVQLL